MPGDRARPFGRGAAYFALRTGAPMVPAILGGIHVLFRGRRILVRFLPAVTGLDLRGAAPMSPAERQAARDLTSLLETAMAPQVAELHHAAEPPPGARRPWLRMTHLWR